MEDGRSQRRHRVGCDWRRHCRTVRVHPDDYAFMAAANPAVILELIARLGSAEYRGQAGSVSLTGSDALLRCTRRAIVRAAAEIGRRMAG